MGRVMNFRNQSSETPYRPVEVEDAPLTCDCKSVWRLDKHIKSTVGYSMAKFGKVLLAPTKTEHVGYTKELLECFKNIN